MRGRSIVLALALFVAPASAIAMKGEQTRGHCRVVGGGKLPSAAGGAEALCAAVNRAIAAQAPGIRYSAEVNVRTPSMLVASLVVEGRALPEQKFAVTDRELGKGSIERFANSLAAVVANAAKP